VYLEYGRAARAIGLHSTTGDRIAIANSAAGHAYAAALDADVGNALLAEMEREIPQQAKCLRASLEHNRGFLREHGYVVACGSWSPHINGLAVPLWSPQYQTFVVVTIGLLSAMYDEARLHSEVAPAMLELGAAIAGMLDNSDTELFHNRLQGSPHPATMRENNKITATGDANELEAGTRRSRAPRGIGARDGRR
jgi:DNA-binding IclR family transcriptional regulator